MLINIENKLTVIGDRDYVISMLDEITDAECYGAIDFERIVPEPDELKVHGKEQERLEWRRQNWGTGWNAFHRSYKLTHDGVEISFLTAGSHPGAIVTKLREEYSELRFETDW